MAGNGKPQEEETPAKPLTPEAERALAEAEARRQNASTGPGGPGSVNSKEIGGREGPDPVRFGDWEKGGLVSDF